jgi:hypothetical protein
MPTGYINGGEEAGPQHETMCPSCKVFTLVWHIIKTYKASYQFFINNIINDVTLPLSSKSQELQNIKLNV